MSITIDECDFIKEIFKKEMSDQNLESELEPGVYDFLSKQGNLNTISDRLIFSKKTKYRPYDSVIITKFLKSNFNVVDSISELAGYLSGNFLMYIDFHFLFICKNEENTDEKFKFQYGSKASAMNQTHKIVTHEDYNDLINEFKNKTYADLLTDVFVNHVDLYDYSNSGLRPYQLLSLVIYIQKFPE